MIGGNTLATLQKKITIKNAYGSIENKWEDVQSFNGFLDYTSGDGSHNSTFKGAIEETTNIFICDYISLQVTSPTQHRMIIDGAIYDVLLIDDPMRLHHHLEIYLKYNEVVK